MTGRIEKTTGINPGWIIQVDGYDWCKYMDYSKAAAVRCYRAMNGLVGKHIEWRDYTKPGMPQNLFEAMLRYLQAR